MILCAVLVDYLLGYQRACGTQREEPAKSGNGREEAQKIFCAF
jgi:hypothetical protein